MMIISMVLLAGTAWSEASAQGVRDTLVTLCDTVIYSRIDTTAQACDDTLNLSCPVELFVPRLGISTNIPYDITWMPGHGVTSVPSVSVEYYPEDGRWSFGADFECAAWRRPKEHSYIQLYNLTPWARRWFREPRVGERFHGWYALGSLNATRYGIGQGPEKGWEGEGLGASLGIGHKWLLGKRMTLDMGLALGLFYSGYDPYVWGDDATGRYYYDYFGDSDTFVKRNQRFFWAGPTRIYINIGFDLWNRRVGRAQKR